MPQMAGTILQFSTGNVRPDVILFDPGEGKIDFSDIENPTLHILKTNKLVDTSYPTSQDSDLSIVRSTSGNKS